MKKVILMLLLISLSINQAFACSCGGESFSLGKKVKIEFKRSDLVFTGKVLEIIDNEKGEISSSAYPLIYKFEVTQTFKGKPQNKIIEVISEKGGYRFNIGETYLVYSFNSDFYNRFTGNNSDIVTGSCGRNNLLSNIEKKEIKKLERLSKRAN